MFRTVPRFERYPGLALESAAASLLAASVVLTVFGSSSVEVLVQVGRPMRWVALGALAVVAASLAIRSRHGRPRRPLTLLAATAAALGLEAVVSAGYSIEPRVTAERAVSFVVALSTAVLLAYAAEVRPGLGRRLLAGAVAGAIVAAAGGLLVYAFDRSAAVQQSQPGVPARWRGLGENPNTLSLLAAVDMGAAVWFAATSTRWRPIWASGAAGLALTILASGSRGALVAGVAGAAIVAATLPRSATHRLALVVATFVAGGVGGLAVDAVATPQRRSRRRRPAS